MSNDQENLSQRLRFAMRMKRFSQTALAKRINVKPQIIQYLCAGQAGKSKFTFDIAEALGIDVAWLATGKGVAPSENEFAKDKQKNITNTIPILDFPKVKEWKVQHQEIDLQKISNRIPVVGEADYKSFAVILNDKSMSPRFDFGTIVVIDPDVDVIKAPLNHRFVLVYLAKEDFIIFRQLEIVNDQKTLIPLNNTLHTRLPLDENDIILGLCKEARWNISGANYE